MSDYKKDVSAAEFHGLVHEVREMKGLMSQMVEALTRITLLDERQQVVGAFMQKLDERMARAELRQHEAEIANALVKGGASRLTSIEAGFREMHLDRERDKARFQAVVWMVRGLWAVAGGGIIAILGYLAKVGA